MFLHIHEAIGETFRQLRLNFPEAAILNLDDILAYQN
jgi:hypothetical protein